MDYESYRQYLRSPHWRSFSKVFYECFGDEIFCAKCGGKQELNIHHKHYRTLGHETLDDMEVLCKRCHNDTHFQPFLLEELKKGKRGGASLESETMIIRPIPKSDIFLKNPLTTRYFFLDEAGDLYFRPSSSRYYIITCLSTNYVGELAEPLYNLKHDLIRDGIDIEYFHASEDKQHIRNKVFEVLKSANDYEIDSLVVEKPKTVTRLQDAERFYPKMYFYLLRYVFKRSKRQNTQQCIVITDTIPVKKKCEAIEKGIKTAVKSILGDLRFFVAHHSSKSHYYLQATDYCAWATYRKWQHRDERSYEYIRGKVRSEFDIFRTGKTFYY